MTDVQNRKLTVPGEKLTVSGEKLTVSGEKLTVPGENHTVPGEMNAVPTKMLSIWFFVSIVLAVFGLIILAMGIYHYVSPPADPTHQLAHLHADLWWGMVMVVFAAALYVGDRMSKE
jgi:hypothetical protein